ncbi:hypothetical protein [Mycobacteroides abscessus]|uniref:hypothetical protein n=1 Tax=Mycobacteroides abscessus TaxID=36809 RepID=UPI000926EEEC|nr:hypothetical protein [Mycobacteroides abscessus]SHY52551.1 Uncharacterised protein [Mycobacteroides abscessus subsp. abscessus]SHY62008.1 Uncharacterised protein [Mycobacteroides abscessus subsp. abscessus]SHY71389.1 Uncharacterised protein [Mycobacteroides abscessus subsp. abscessus]SIA16195.1 Uncharacterised protein [Mycobacteroides abscessus subsp. abscessus]SIB16900.1 Uncharacterised protein [Mycobacteroides abscessus subsp. abscessus]
MRILVLLAILIVIGLIAYTVYATVRWRERGRLIEGLNDPVKWLSRKERREHARALLAREQDEYDQKRQQQIESTINQFLERQSKV